jgi:hypothetical protein
VPSAGQKIPVQPGWYLPPQKIPLTENSFLEAGNEAENTEEIQAVLYTIRNETMGLLTCLSINEEC